MDLELVENFLRHMLKQIHAVACKLALKMITVCLLHHQTHEKYDAVLVY